MFSLQAAVSPRFLFSQTRISASHHAVILSLMVLVAICIVGCGSPPPSSSTSDSTSNSTSDSTSNCTVQPNFICGRVVDAGGKPLSNVIIEAVGRATAVGSSDPLYHISVHPDGTYGPTQLIDGSYTISARVQVTYQGVDWSLYIPPDDNVDSGLLSANGIVKNFTWKLTGLEPGGDPDNPDSHYGASIYVEPLQQNIPAGSHLHFSLVPQGPLVDGSTGQSLTFDKSLITEQEYAENRFLMDIPLGVYIISATGTDPNGNALNICINGQPKTTIVFTNTDASQGSANAVPDLC